MIPIRAKYNTEVSEDTNSHQYGIHFGEWIFITFDNFSVSHRFVGFSCKVWTARNELLSYLKPANCWLHGLYNRRRVVRFCILLFRIRSRILDLLRKNVTGWCGFSQRRRCMGKALSRLSSIVSLIGVFPIKRKFGLVGVFILREWCGYKGRWSDCAVCSVWSVLYSRRKI